jgi:uncharacterized membrane protein
MSDQNSDEHIKKQIQEFMDRFRGELKEFREFSHQDQLEVNGLDSDPAYQALVEQGDVTINDDYKVNRIYPSLREIEAEYQKRKKESDEKKELDRKQIELRAQNVYLKAFRETHEEQNDRVSLRLKRNRLGLDTSMDKITKKDLESFVGEDLISKISVVGFLITAIIAYQYAVSNGFVPIPVRMSVGFGLGFGFFIFSHIAQKKNTSISLIVSLVGVLLNAATIYLSHYSYGVIEKPLAIGLLLFCVSVPAIQAVLYSKPVFAIVGLVGLCLAPLPLVSYSLAYTDFLFYYFGVSLLFGVVAYLRGWRVLNIITFFIYVLLFVVWGIIGDFSSDTQQIKLFSFSSLYFALTFCNLLLYNLKKENEYHIIDGYLLIFNNLIFVFSAGRAFDKLTAYGFGVFIAALAVFNLFYIVLIYARRYADRPMIELMILFVAVSLMVTGLIETSGIYSNNWFAVLAVVLVGLGHYFQERVPKLLGLISLLMSILILIGAWSKVYWFPGLQTYSFLVNEGAWGGLLTFLAVVVVLYLTQNDEEILGLPSLTVRNIWLSLLLVIGYLLGIFELSFHTPELVGGWDLRILLIVAFNMVFSIALWLVIRKFELERFESFGHWAMGLMVLSYILVGHWDTVELRNDFAEGRLPFFPFGFHYFIVATSVLIGYILIKEIVQSPAYKSEGKNGYVMWFMGLMLFLHVTAELEHTVVVLASHSGPINSTNILEQVRLVGYTILWPLVGFGFLVAGLYYKIKELRIMGLAAFALSFAKFLIFDFWSMSMPSKLFSFFVISAILFVVARIYKKIRIMLEKGDISVFRKEKQS